VRHTPAGEVVVWHDGAPIPLVEVEEPVRKNDAAKEKSEICVTTQARLSTSMVSRRGAKKRVKSTTKKKDLLDTQQLH